MGNNPSFFKSTGNRPVDRISWYDAIEFCNKLSEKEGLTPYYTVNLTTIDPNNTNIYEPLRWLVKVNNNATGYR